MTDPVLIRQTETFVEWRVCGRSKTRGPWEGVWRRQREDDWELRQLAKRNNEVWLERREVTLGAVERVEIGDA